MTTICRLVAVLMASLFADTVCAQSVLVYHGDPSRGGRYVLPDPVGTPARS
jgi:hypothetical protein